MLQTKDDVRPPLPVWSFLKTLTEFVFGDLKICLCADERLKNTEKKRSYACKNTHGCVDTASNRGGE